jgi:imidazoleglycerol phosphate dehydratase HisB
MDETLASAAVDFSGRPYFVFTGEFPREQVGGLATELVPHFFRSLCETAGLNLNLQVRGENAHNMVEACFKATARALRVPSAAIAALRSGVAIAWCVTCRPKSTTGAPAAAAAVRNASRAVT